MKKTTKILLIIAAVLIIAVSSLAVWQWNNIKSIYNGVNESGEEIQNKRTENQKELVYSLNEYLDDDVRELTDEEKTQIETGEISVDEVYLRIFEEKQAVNSENQGSVDSNSKDKSASAKVSKDEIVVKYMTQLYSMQSKYTAQAEKLIQDGKNYYKYLRKTQNSATAKTNTITHFTSIVRGVESACDSEFEALISELEKELGTAGENTDITRTIRNSYKKEKQLKLSYYANRYLK